MNQISSVLLDFLTLFTSIIVEAMPFILLGISFSILVSLFMNDKMVLKIKNANPLVRMPLIGLVGVFMPVCECGNVPIARRLLQNKFSISETTVFLVAAPIVNPITFISTYQAFNFDPSIAWLRISLGYLMAITAGLLFLRSHRSKYIEEKFENLCKDHAHYESKAKKAIDIFSSEFILLIKMLFLGAFIASAIQILVPREIIASLNNNIILSILAMMVLAFVVSICSNIDAFFALSFSNIFPSSSLLAFMLFGPVIDIKMLTLLKSTFKNRYLVKLSIVIFVFVLIACLGVSVVKK